MADTDIRSSAPNLIRNRWRAAQLIAACTVLFAGWGGIYLLAEHRPPSITPQRMLIAPMIGIVEPCILAVGRASAPGNTLTEACTHPQGSAAALVESTLALLETQDARDARFELGYTLPVPLLQLLRRGPHDWEPDTEAIGRLVRTVRDSARPVILYLFSTHFSTDAPLEQQLAVDASNLAVTRDGPMAQGQYYGAPINHWTVATTNNDITRYRVRAARLLLAELCRLPPADINKIRGISLLGELHHYFPDFEQGMGFTGKYRVSDYSAASVAGFRQALRSEFKDIARLNAFVGATYRSFDAVDPPSKDIRTERLGHFTEHIDAYAHGTFPVSGWAHLGNPDAGRTPKVHVYLNGAYYGKTLVNQRRQDVLAAHPEFGPADTGWRLDVDFRRLPPGLHQIDVYLETLPGQLSPIGSRQIAIMDRQQTTPTLRPQQDQLPHAHASAHMTAQLDQPQDAQSYFHNPLVRLWQRHREQQIVDYLQHFNASTQIPCLNDIPRYSHQIIPFANPSWDANKFGVGASLRDTPGIRLGVSLYGDAAYGDRFDHWLARTSRTTYGITEFHPLKPMDASELGETFRKHARQGAQFLSFFAEPRWQGKLVPRGHNMFSFDPANNEFYGASLYFSAKGAIQRNP